MTTVSAPLLLPLSPKFLSAFLHGLTRLHFYKDAVVTRELLREQIFVPTVEAEGESCAIDLDNLDDVFSDYIRFLTELVYNYCSPTKLEACLSKANYPADVIAVFVSFWNSEREKTHAVMVAESNFDNKLEKMSWRVDIPTISKHEKNLNKSVALIEFSIREYDGKLKLVNFEVGAEQLKDIMGDLDKIEKVMLSRT